MMRSSGAETLSPSVPRTCVNESVKKLKYLNTPRMAKLIISDVISSVRREDCELERWIERAMKKSMAVLPIISSRNL